jgi:hypothetical protein
LAKLAVAAVGACAIAIASAGVAQTASPQATERAVKAAFLYKFTEYVAWPAAATRVDRPFTIGVVGAGALADELLRMTANRRVGTRPISVRQLTSGDSVEGLDVLFIGGEQRGRLGQLLSPGHGRPILTVTEAVGALADGSVINFTMTDERVRFEVSLDAARASRLRLNSRLLAVAEEVHQAP